MVLRTLSFVAWLTVASTTLGQSSANAVPGQDAGFSEGIDTRQWPLILTPLTLPPAEEAYRGLRASIDAVFRLSFVDGEVTKVELESVEVQTPHDPLPAWFDLLDADSIRSWGNFALQHWRSLQRLPFEWQVRVRFQSNAALAEDEVRYSVRYRRRREYPSDALPLEILIEAAPMEEAKWREILEVYRKAEAEYKRKASRPE
ncbi:MAG: hypothetical protein Kow00109_29390 [Acidobacteriota bacterium]